MGGRIRSIFLAAALASRAASEPLFNDVHFHLTNYVQQGPLAAKFLETMGDAVGRSTLFGIPLQQTCRPGAPRTLRHAPSDRCVRGVLVLRAPLGVRLAAQDAGRSNHAHDPLRPVAGSALPAGILVSFSAQVIDGTACEQTCEEREAVCVEACGTHTDLGRIRGQLPRAAR